MVDRAALEMRSTRKRTGGSNPSLSATGDAAADLISGALRQFPMLRATALICVSIAMQSAAMAEDAKPDTVQVHGKPLQLSCAEWKRNQDGSWTSIGPLLVGTDTVNDVILRGAKDTKVLEDKCRNPSSAPAAAPTQAASPARHQHHHMGAPDGSSQPSAGPTHSD